MAQGSQPGLPQTNAVAERANGEVIAGTRALLVGAGLPYYLLGVCDALLLPLGQCQPKRR